MNHDVDKDNKQHQLLL